jgi:small conductance mechanosensitive channel
MNLFTLLDTTTLDTTSYSTQQIVGFFTIDNLKSVLNDLCKVGLQYIGKIILAYVVWRLGKILIKYILKFSLKALGKSQIDAGVVKFINSIAKFTLYAILLVTVVGILGFETTSLVTVFGSAALAVGISLQGSLSNFAGGILLLIFRPFKIGDYIITGTNEGTVISVEILYTRLRTADNKIVILPNGTLSNSSIINVTGIDEFRRLDIQVGVSYKADVNQAKKVLMKVMESQSDIIKEREMIVVIKSFDDNCVRLETQAWVKNDQYMDVKYRLLEQYKNILDENGIEMPFNQLDVHIRNEE